MKKEYDYLIVGSGLYGALYAQYKALAEQEQRVMFGGRLAEYKYYDMDQVIAAALSLSQREL